MYAHTHTKKEEKITLKFIGKNYDTYEDKCASIMDVHV